MRINTIVFIFIMFILTNLVEFYRIKVIRVKAYNKEAKCGIVGVHRQALYLAALRQEFKERLKESPVYLLEHVLGLVGPIKIVNGNIVIREEV